MNPVLTLTHIKKDFGNLHILKDINLSIMPGELTGLFATSGAGKTTLLHIAGLISPATSGTIYYYGEKAIESKWDKLRSTFGFVFQQHHLIMELNAVENVMVPLLLKGIAKKKAYKAAKDLLIELALEERITAMPDNMSGGENQRVAIARALVRNPSVILADEPTGNLDEETAWIVFQQMKDVLEKHGAAALVITHNKMLAQLYNKVVHLKKGYLY